MISGVAGLLLSIAGILVGLAAVFSKLLEKNRRFKYTLVIVIAFLTLYAAAMSFVSFTNSSDNNLTLTSAPQNNESVQSCNYGIEIQSPTSGEAVGGDFNVLGTYKIKPPDGTVQLLLLSSKANDYYPHGILQFDTSKKTWTGNVFIAPGNPSQDLVIVVAAVGESGRILFDYVKKVGEETQSFPAIAKLTADIVECDRVLVISK